MNDSGGGSEKMMDEPADKQTVVNAGGDFGLGPREDEVSVG